VKKLPRKTAKQQFDNYNELLDFRETRLASSEIGCGMWGTGSWNGSDDDESLRSLQRTAGLGCNFFDKAWACGKDARKRLLGQAEFLWRRKSAVSDWKQF